jgi:CheY-like chemotaxis protein
MVCALNIETRIPANANTLMIVDDEPNIREAFRLMVQHSFPHVDISEAENGQEAISLFSHKHHGVVLMDLNMPVMDGQAAFDQIRSICLAKDWEMPSIVFCTGFAIPNSVQSIIKENARHQLLIKPITGRKMTETLQTRLV